MLPQKIKYYWQTAPLKKIITSEGISKKSINL